MSSKKWVSICLLNTMSSTLSIRNASLSWGKWHEDGDQDNEISNSEVDNKTARSNESVKINSCGREGSPSGTMGGFEIYDGETKIGKIHWDCPWGGDNEFVVDERDEGYMVDVGSWSSQDAIGTVQVAVDKLD
ncbi:Asp-hemolysin [Aspergillus nomiae NRRL 13137]|uniref:Asp-hemolysin n=1 Tax=Aspergillus nomiae NRRL (strain ATCC 15546 / NRRL 13137 / CBS 260.88 / M93) TaxID=1509407 RepID=A0A0L1IYV1_ASPN3|nr:Asp-hemolysin [Aspergillus nomiae NRRL 13137]KNG84343.1 Asp-hemolysin [Aspergillus nomiae NRRL 13137]